MNFPDAAEIFDAVNTVDEDYLSFFRRMLTPQTDVLELGCGTGRLLFPLVSHCRHATGLDHSRVMLDAARRKAGLYSDRVPELFCDSFVSFELVRQHDLIYFSNDTFSMVTSVIDRQKALLSASRNLRNGGRLLIPLSNPARYLRAVEETFDRTGSIPGRGTIRVLEHRRADLLRSWRVGYKQEIFTPADGGEVQILNTVRPLAIIGRGELRLALAAAGLAVESEHGWWDHSIYTADSQRYICVARKLR